MVSKSKRALVIVFDGIEEVEALTPIDILRRANVEVTIASVSGAPSVTGRNDITFTADTPLSLVENERYDLVFLPGGPGVLELLNDRQVRDILLSHYNAKCEIAAICAAPKVLANHGLLNTCKATSHASVRDDLPKPSNEEVVVQNNITTSQGVGTAVAFSLALVEKLVDKTTAKEIAESIHFKTIA